ncbi:MAG: hypothetical protein J0L55_02085 [Caulobacterales bacterium]|nr:hypothetical protein [Caulobacterales bacterium]MCA0372208.1 hypothetical protein [Pseudomonadota bacterium]
MMKLNKSQIVHKLKVTSFIFVIAIIQTLIWFESIRLLIIETKKAKGLLYGAEIFLFTYYYFMIAAITCAIPIVFYFYAKTFKLRMLEIKTSWILGKLRSINFTFFLMIVGFFTISFTTQWEFLEEFADYFFNP